MTQTNHPKSLQAMQGLPPELDVESDEKRLYCFSALPLDLASGPAISRVALKNMLSQQKVNRYHGILIRV